MQRNRSLGTALSMECDEGAEIEIGEHVAVDDDKGLIDAPVEGSEPDRTGRVERFGLDGIRQRDPRRTSIGVGLLEGVREVAQRKNCLVHAVRRQVRQHPLDHGHPDDGQHLFGYRQREGTQPRPLAAHENNRLH
jgi:hypothetical protein